MLYEFKVKTLAQISFADITDQVNQVVLKSGVKEGIALVFTPHTTAAITINENADPDVLYDLERISSRVVPRENNYKHLEGNSSAHMLSSLIGASESLIINNGKLYLGTWQGVYLAEFDGPRERKVTVKIQGG